MKLLFVKSQKIGSKIIRWGTESRSSHFAICFDEDENGGGIIFHSHGSGPQLEWFGNFIEKNHIVFSLEFKAELTLGDEEAIYKGIIRQFSKDWYDYPAMAWWLYRGILWKYFGIKFPMKNDWAKNGFALCTALAGGIEWVKQYAKEQKTDLEMITPDALCRMLLYSGYFKSSDPKWIDLINIIGHKWS